MVVVKKETTKSAKANPIIPNELIKINDKATNKVNLVRVSMKRVFDFSSIKK